MPLANYRSKSPITNILAEIENQLITHGAKQIVRDYDGNSRIVAISFVIDIKGKMIGFKLPAKVDRVEAIFKEQGLVMSKPDQAYRTAWATIRDWVKAQMALIDWEVVKLQEVFLPYAVDQNGKTFYEIMEDRQFSLPEPKL